MRCAILLTTKSNSILFLCFSLFRQLRSCHLDQLCKMPEIVQVKDSSEECNKMENALEALNEVLKLKMKSVVQDLEIKQLKEDLAKLMQDINKLETALTWDF